MTTEEIDGHCFPALCQDRLLLGKLSGDSILTLGSDHAIMDYERAWRRELGACSAKYRGAAGAQASHSNLNQCKLLHLTLISKKACLSRHRHASESGSTESLDAPAAQAQVQDRSALHGHGFTRQHV